MQKNHPEVSAQSQRHPKVDFQVERIAFFSDAVFAIAITLLVIEFKIPEITRETTLSDVLHDLKGLQYKFLALILSFSLITNYWMRHHTLFKYLHDYNRRIVLLNMLSLLPIIFFPFTTAFFYEAIEHRDIVVIPYRLFLFNNLGAGATSFLLYYTITSKSKQLSYPMDAEDHADFRAKLGLMLISFLLMFILSYLIPFEYSFFGILPMIFVRKYKGYIKKKMK